MKFEFQDRIYLFETVLNVSIATSQSWKDRETGAQQERTEWHRVVFFNRLGEIVSEYLHKGSKIYVEGYLRTHKWTDNNQIERYTTEIVASEMQMLDSRGDQGGANNGQPSGAMPGVAPAQQHRRSPLLHSSRRPLFPASTDSPFELAWSTN